MRVRAVSALFAAVAAFAWTGPASAALLITVDKPTQRMTVELDGQQIFDWPVSTGVQGRDTPNGDYKPFRKEKEHYSREWDDAPMPNSIFFTMQGHAIHGSSHVKALGTPASHGCVRLSLENSETLWKLVAQEKMANTRIVLRGDTPAPAPPPPVASAPDTKKKARAAARDNDDIPPRATQRSFDASPRVAQRNDDPDFTSALGGTTEYVTREGQRLRGPSGAAFYDGRYYYDRQGRRMASAAAPRQPRDPYYEAPQDQPPRGYRRGYFPGPGWN